MTLLTPQLALKRLVIVSRGTAVYDEKFRLGINIIRGSNSSGKSTIADFIFYVLGGELIKFKEAAERCSEVFAEVEINGSPVTIRRMIELGGKQPILISMREYENAIKSVVEGWQVYSMVRSSKKESASEVLFRMLGFPEVKTDTENNITMHQVLRLMYADQVSAPSSLMRDERFDPALVRQAVGDLLLGVYDDLLFSEMRQLRDKRNQFEAISHQLDALYTVLGGIEIEVDEKALSRKLEKVKVDLKKVDDSLKSASAMQFNKGLIAEVRQNIEKLAGELGSLQAEAARKLQQITDLELEISDSDSFIQDLRSRLLAVDDSLVTRHFLGELPLTHCPQCLSELKKREDEKLCVLCGNAIPENPTDSRALKMKHELGQQLKESQLLLQDKVRDVVLLKSEIPKLTELVAAKRQQYEEAVQRVRPEREEAVDLLYINKGELMAEIENISKQLKTAAIVKEYEARKTKLSSSIKELIFSIEKRKQMQLERRAVGQRAIEENALEILRNDLARQGEFAVGKTIQIDFGSNTFALDGKNQFSASSVAYLKNSVHFGIFFASLQLDFFRYPRFIMCDNVEDKGLEQDRSRNFQKILVHFSEKFPVAHQIIFTTSMIDPSLNNEKYCVGPEYNEHRKSLDFSKIDKTSGQSS